LRAVRIVRRLAFGVVLAMDRSPLLGDHPGGEPEPRAEEVAHDRMHIERAMRLAAMQVDRDRGDRDLDQDQAHDDIAPPGEVQETAEHWIFCIRKGYGRGVYLISSAGSGFTAMVLLTSCFCR